MQKGKIRLLVVDDHTILRQGLRRILEAEPDMTVVGEAATGKDAVERAQQLKPDVVLLDVSMPELDGIESLRQIRGSGDPRVLMLSVHLEHHVISEAVTAGASGYLTKESLDTELTAAIRTVMQGGSVFSPNVSQILAEPHHRKGLQASAKVLESLTNREREIFVLLAEGKSPSEIAAALFVSPKTVHTHRQHIMEKLGLQTTTELIRFALKEGLIKTI